MVNKEQILNEVLLKMSYNPSLTLKENIELLEQPESVMDRRVGITAKNAEALGMSQGEYEKRVQKVMSDKAESFGEFISDPHVFLPVAAAIATIVTGGMAGLVIAGVLEVADIALYIKEKDYTSAGLGIVFAMIPGGMLLNKLGVGQVTKQEVKVLIKKLKQGLDLTNKERKIIEAIDNNKQWIARTIAQQSAKALSRKILAKYTGRKLLIVILYMIKYGLLPYRFGWRVVALGGGFFTALQIGKLLGIGIKGLDYRTVELPQEYVKLPKQKKESVKKEVLIQVIEQSPEIKNIVQKETDKIINTSDEKKVEQINQVLLTLDEELDQILN
jgi:hypothetical protein